MHVDLYLQYNGILVCAGAAMLPQASAESSSGLDIEADQFLQKSVTAAARFALATRRLAAAAELSVLPLVPCMCGIQAKNCGKQRKNWEP